MQGLKEDGDIEILFYQEKSVVILILRLPMLLHNFFSSQFICWTTQPRTLASYLILIILSPSQESFRRLHVFPQTERRNQSLYIYIYIYKWRGAMFEKLSAFSVSSNPIACFARQQQQEVRRPFSKVNSKRPCRYPSNSYSLVPLLPSTTVLSASSAMASACTHLL
jgi:hypothetical protein